MTHTEALVLLRLSGQPDTDEIKQAYRRLARIYHPDAGGSHFDFVRLQRAYIVAQNPPEQEQREQSPPTQSAEEAWTWMEDWFKRRYPKYDDTLTYLGIAATVLLALFGFMWLIRQPGMLWEMRRILLFLQGPVGVMLGVAVMGYIASKAFQSAIGGFLFLVATAGIVLYLPNLVTVLGF